MRADATIPIMSARAQVSYLRDEKNVSFELMGEEDAVAFLEERSFFFKLKAFAKDFEKYSCKPGEKGRYVNLDFGHLVELSKLDKALRSLVLDLALDIEHYLKVRINACCCSLRSDAKGLRKHRSPNPKRDPVPIEKKVQVIAELEARTGPAEQIAEKHGVSRTAIEGGQSMAGLPGSRS